MNGSVPVPVRLYGFLLRRLVPSLGQEYAREATEAFRALWAEAWVAGPRAFLYFMVREFRSLIASGLAELGSRRRMRSSGGKPPKRRPPLLTRTAGVLDVLKLDVRYTLRSLARAPGFVIVSVLSLTFGIGVSTGLFSVVNASLFRPLPHAREPQELVRVFSTGGSYQTGPVSYPDFLDIREMTETLEDLAVSRGRGLVLGAPSEGNRTVSGLEVSENYFDVLGIQMARGRTFLPGDVIAGGQVAVIGHRLWKDRFDGDPGVLGQTLPINGSPYTIIGVGPEGMVGLQGPEMIEVVIPSMEFRDHRGYASNTGVGRLKEGVTIQQVRAQLDAVATHLAEEHPDFWAPDEYREQGLTAMTLRESMLPGEAAFALAAAGFLTVVGLILLIACSNVANLLLTRAWKRREEVAIRSAIGAPSRRIFGQLLTENLVLFGLAGILSLLLVQWLATLAASGTRFLPPVHINVTPDFRVVLFVIGLALVTGLSFGLLPASHASRPNLVPALKGREAPPKYRFLGIRNLLVGAQVGGSLVLVLVSALLIQSLSHASHLDLGFEAEGVAVAELDLSYGDYEEGEARQFLTDLRERVESSPEVTGTALASRIPLQGGSTRMGGLEPEGYEPAPGEHLTVGMSTISPGYLEVMGIRLLRGRDLSAEDVAEAEKVLLVSQAFVDRFWPGESGLGKRVASGQRPPYRVVGVVEDIPWALPGEEPQPTIWVPFSQAYQSNMILHVRTSGDSRALLPGLRERLADLDPDLPLVRLDRLESITANATLLHRILSIVLGLAGAVTMALAMLGIYGVVAFSVSQRTREVGLRIALGAEPREVVRMVVKEGLGLALIGMVPGIVLSVVAAVLLRVVLLGLQPMDPIAFGGSVTLLLLSVLAASLGPARRAARAHPMDALRED